MGNSVTLGGDRLGSGKKNKVYLHGFERSTHDLGFVFRNTQAPGTLVPFMNLLALPGDTFDINLGADVKTHPTVGPLFGSFKLQLDVFMCPIRLYNSWIHNNKLMVGMDMSKVLLPQMGIDCSPVTYTENGIDKIYPIVPVEMQQINPSSLLSYLGLKGLGTLQDVNLTETNPKIYRNGVPYLAYWDIFKNYYANKSEDNAYFINTPYSYKLRQYFTASNTGGTYITDNPGLNLVNSNIAIAAAQAQTVIAFINISDLAKEGYNYTDMPESKLWMYVGLNGASYIEERIEVDVPGASWGVTVGGDKIFANVTITSKNAGTLLGFDVLEQRTSAEMSQGIQLSPFALDDLDKIREMILATPGDELFDIADMPSPYGPHSTINSKANISNSVGQTVNIYSQQGLAVKTYQSDIFNNWLNTEWVDGTGGINDITKIDTSSGSFEINTLNLANKVYKMLTRIAVSGGSYEDWVQAVYDTDIYKRAETPVYVGGLSKEIIFQEVVSTAAVTSESGDVSSNPLGSLAGKGGMATKHKGGTVTVKVSEPCVIMGIVSITPRVDYSQGNDWTVNLKNWNDFHKPNLDEIGFQDLLTDQMAWFDNAVLYDESVIFKSAGKQPAWINYMTNYNKLFGNFADPNSEMFMTLARKYDSSSYGVNDITTYIDPSKYNYAFAQTDLTSQNFWVQIGCDIIARRKMSAKIMPNL